MFDTSRIPERMWAEICDGTSFFVLFLVCVSGIHSAWGSINRLGSYHARIAGCFCSCCGVFSERTVQPREVRTYVLTSLYIALTGEIIG